MSMSTEVNQIICGDCLEVMAPWPDAFVDLTVTSPPYEDARLYGELGFKIKGQAWVDWMVPRVVEMCRVTNGLVLVNMAGKVRQFKYSPVVEWLVADLTRQHGLVCGPSPYCYARRGIAGSGSKHYHARAWEPVYAFARPERLPLAWSDNTAMGHLPRWAPGGAMSHRVSSGARVNQWGHSIKTGGTGGDVDNVTCTEARPSHRLATPSQTQRQNGADGNGSYVPPAIANPGNVIKCKVGGGHMGSPLAHDNEAPFPEQLAEFFVRSYCKPGGIAFDAFSGSGTVAAVAKRTGRRWLGIDVRESQVELARRRLATVQPELIA